MSLIQELTDQAGELVNLSGSDWLDRVEAGARKKLPSIAAAASKALPDGVEVTEAQAGEVLDKLAAGKAPLLRMTSMSFAHLVGEFSNGNKDKAQRNYLAHPLTFDERNAAIDAAGDAAFDEAKSREEAWEAVVEWLEGLGLVASTILGAVVRLAVGLA